MSIKEVKFWKAFFFAVILSALLVVTVWALSAYFAGDVTFTSAEYLTVTLTGTGSSRVSNDDLPLGVVCNFSTSGDQWSLAPDQGSSGDTCEYELLFDANLPSFLEPITPDPLASGIVDVSLVGPAECDPLPAGPFSINLRANIMSVGSGVVYNFSGFQIGFSDTLPAGCP